MSTTNSLFAAYEQREEKILKDFFEFLSFKSVATDHHYHEDVLACANWLENYLTQMGMTVERWETAGYPVIFASHLKAGPDKPTVLIYNHYDVQPADPLELWKSPPFEPSIRDGEVYARGAQDNKGQCHYVLNAIKYLLETNKELPVNLKLLIEGEEEGGSQNLPETLKLKAKQLKADHLIVADVGTASMTTPTITLGLRGVLMATLELSGSKTDLHSGLYGGLVYNPNHALVGLLAKLRDDKGRIAVPGFYDEVTPISEKDKNSLSSPVPLTQILAAIGAEPCGGEKDFSPLESTWLRPTLEINGIGGGYAAEGFKAVIPAKATAKISCRLVPKQEPEVIAQRLEHFLRQNCPEGISLKFTLHPGSGIATRSEVDSNCVQAANKAYTEVFGKPASFVLEGASVPIVHDLKEISGAELLLMGFGLPDDQIHAPNEHFGLDRMKMGFATIIRILEILGARTSTSA